MLRVTGRRGSRGRVPRLRAEPQGRGPCVEAGDGQPTAGALPLVPVSCGIRMSPPRRPCPYFRVRRHCKAQRRQQSVLLGPLWPLPRLLQAFPSARPARSWAGRPLRPPAPWGRPPAGRVGGRRARRRRPRPRPVLATARQVHAPLTTPPLPFLPFPAALYASTVLSRRHLVSSSPTSQHHMLLYLARTTYLCWGHLAQAVRWAWRGVGVVSWAPGLVSGGSGGDTPGHSQSRRRHPWLQKPQSYLLLTSRRPSA